MLLEQMEDAFRASFKLIDFFGVKWITGTDIILLALAAICGAAASVHL